MSICISDTWTWDGYVSAIFNVLCFNMRNSDASRVGLIVSQVAEDVGYKTVEIFARSVSTVPRK
jgi:AraC-like DNA-binding protein